MHNYPGYRTATVQTAFRYDHPQENVREAIQRLGELMPETEPRILSDEELANVYQLMDAFSIPYKAIIWHRDYSGGTLIFGVMPAQKSKSDATPQPRP